jgi:hypothetical protein
MPDSASASAHAPGMRAPEEAPLATRDAAGRRLPAHSETLRPISETHPPKIFGSMTLS